MMSSLADSSKALDTKMKESEVAMFTGDAAMADHQVR